MARMLLAVVFICAMFVVYSSAQLNFSTGWGKRGGVPLEGCKGSMEALMNLYKLVQSEAQKIVECEKFSN